MPGFRWDARDGQNPRKSYLREKDPIIWGKRRRGKNTKKSNGREGKSPTLLTKKTHIRCSTGTPFRRHSRRKKWTRKTEGKEPPGFFT